MPSSRNVNFKNQTKQKDEKETSNKAYFPLGGSKEKEKEKKKASLFLNHGRRIKVLAWKIQRSQPICYIVSNCNTNCCIS